MTRGRTTFTKHTWDSRGEATPARNCTVTAEQLLYIFLYK
jgi:hypothetical protein